MLMLTTQVAVTSIEWIFAENISVTVKCEIVKSLLNKVDWTE